MRRKTHHQMCRWKKQITNSW